MITINNERLESLQRQFKEEGFNDISDSEIMQLAEENLALRKERERAEPVYQCMDDGKWYDTEKRLYDEVKENGNECRVLYTAPPAPVVPDDVIAALRKVAKIRLDFNDFDGDRRGMADCLGEAEEALIEVVNRRAAMLQSGNDEIGSWGNHKTTPTDKPKSKMRQQAEQLLRDTTALAATLSAETDTTEQQFESLAGKAVVPEGWKLVPAQPTQAMCDAVLGWACFTFNGDGAKRIYEAMLAVAPEPCK
ncbi:hypothetical protein ACLRFU_001480 [Cronobacter sakazakii]